MKIILIAFLTQFLVSCGKDYVYVDRPIPGPTVEIPGSTVTIEIPSPPLTLEQQTLKLVDEKNVFRIAGGQLPLTKGLTCTVHSVTNPNLSVSWPNPLHTFTHLDEFNQPERDGSLGVNVLPINLRPLFTNQYGIRCQGNLVVLTSGYHLFKLTSDDGSRLYINNNLIIDNNGNHAMTTLSTSRLLEKGIHSFRLDYASTGGGQQGIILENEVGVIPSYLFYR